MVKKIILFCFFVSIIFPGCITTRSLIVETDPPEAEIFINGTRAGVGKVEQQLEFTDTVPAYDVLVKSDGYIDFRRKITPPEESAPIHLRVHLEKQEFLSFIDYKIEMARGIVRLVNYKTMGHIDITDKLPLARITDLLTDDVILMPALSPDGRSLAFCRIDPSNKNISISNLWQIMTEGKGISELTSGAALDLSPTFSFDGRLLVFSSDRNTDHHQLWQIQPQVSTALTLILSTESNVTNPYISSDDRKVVFELWPKRGPGPIICSLQRDTGLVTQLGIGYLPKWSPDGKRVVYVKKSEQVVMQNGPEWALLLHEITPSNIWVMDADGANPTQLTFDTMAENNHPQWSYDGSRIVFSSTRGYDAARRHNYDIWVMNATGGNLTQLTTNASQDDYPVFESTSTYVYFRSNRGGRSNIWRLQLPR